MIIINAGKGTIINSVVPLTAELQATPHLSCFLLIEPINWWGVDVTHRPPTVPVAVLVVIHRLLDFKMEKHVTNYHSCS